MPAGTDHCDVKTLILRSLELHFGILGEHFGIIWQVLGLPWGALGAFWRRGRILTHFPTKGSFIWGALLASKILKVTKKLKKQCPKSSVEKMCYQIPCKMAQSEVYIVNTIWFERSDIIHLGGFWSHFGFLFE